MTQNEGRSGSSQTNWERETLEKVLLASIEEQRRARRWSVFFKSAVLLLVVAAFLQNVRPWASMAKNNSGKHTAVIDVAGLIAPGQPASADNIIQGLRDASEDPNTKGIILRMNSPGGSPVQSASIYEEVRRLKKLKPELPIHAVVVDMCASGGYYIAAAADRIYVSSASVVGSIGVIMGSFGFVDAMKTLGVERRVMTAGAHKAMLDPFAPVDQVARQHMQGVIEEVHRQFSDAVRQGRGSRLKETPDMFSGLIWTGEDAIKLGLADELGTTRSVAEDVIGAKKVVNFNPDENVFDQFTRKMGGTMGQTLVEAMSQRMLLQ